MEMQETEWNPLSTKHTHSFRSTVYIFLPDSICVSIFTAALKQLFRHKKLRFLLGYYGPFGELGQITVSA